MEDRRTETVRRFYTEAPFPSYGARDTLASLRLRAERSPLARLLDEAIPQDARVLDLGCGTGQMTIFLANGKRRVVGADLTRASLALARGRGAPVRRGADALRGDRSATPGFRRGAIRRGPLARRPAPHAGPARGLRRRGAPGATGWGDRGRPLQRLRAGSAPAAPPGGARDGDASRPLGPGPLRRARPSRRAARPGCEISTCTRKSTGTRSARSRAGSATTTSTTCAATRAPCSTAVRREADELFSPAEDDWWPEGHPGPARLDAHAGRRGRSLRRDWPTQLPTAADR